MRPGTGTGGASSQSPPSDGDGTPPDGGGGAAEGGAGADPGGGGTRAKTRDRRAGASAADNGAGASAVESGAGASAVDRSKSALARAAIGGGDAPSDWAYDEIEKCADEGYISGDFLSRYQADVTRADFCKVLANVLLNRDPERFFEYVGADSPFADLDEADVPEIIALYELGIVQGVGGGRFNPDGEITRQEAAVMLYRAAVNFGVRDRKKPAEFADWDLVADWAADAVGFVVNKNIMKGTGNGMFSPLGSYTREQAYVTMIRLADIVPVVMTFEKYYDNYEFT